MSRANQNSYAVLVCGLFSHLNAHVQAPKIRAGTYAHDIDIRWLDGCHCLFLTIFYRRRPFNTMVTGMGEMQAYSYGFAYATKCFDDALNQAMDTVGTDARIIVNVPLAGVPLPPQNRVKG